MGLLEGLEDWGVKEIVDNVIAGYIKDGTIPAGDKPAFEKVGIDIANAVIAVTAKKVGVTAQPDDTQA